VYSSVLQCTPVYSSVLQCTLAYSGVRDLVSRFDVRRFSSPTLAVKEFLKTVLGDL
jgi:hypothetical protein